MHANESLFSSKHVERKRDIAKAFHLGVRILKVTAPFEVVITSLLRANGILMDVAEGHEKLIVICYRLASEPALEHVPHMAVSAIEMHRIARSHSLHEL